MYVSFKMDLVNKTINESFLESLYYAEDLEDDADLRNMSEGPDWRRYDYRSYDSVSFTTYWSYIICVLSSIAVVLNILIIFGICSLKGSLKTQMKLLLSLSISDCLLAVLRFLQYFYNFMTVWSLRYEGPVDIALMIRCSLKSVDLNRNNYSFYGHFLSKQILASLYIIAQFAGLGTVILLSIDVLIKVWKPLKYNILMSKRRGNAITVCIWLAPSVIFVLLLGTLCKDGKLGFYFIIMMISSYFHLLYLPCFIAFVIIYLIIVCLIRNYHKRRPSGQLSSNKKYAVTIFIILITYFISVVSALQTLFSATPYTTGFLGFLFTLNITLDPIIYAFRLQEIRHAVWTKFSFLCTTSN